MPKYVIERDLTGIGNLTEAEFKGMAQRSNEISAELGGKVHWLESFIVQNKTYCIYVADNEESIKKHASMGKFPCTSVAKVLRIIDKTTAEK